MEQFFKIKKVDGRWRWLYERDGVKLSNSHVQYGTRECKANLVTVVTWITKKVLPGKDANSFTLLARGQRTTDLLIVPYIGGWNWRLFDGRKVYFQPLLEKGFSDEIEAFMHFERIRKSFETLPKKAIRKVQAS